MCHRRKPPKAVTFTIDRINAMLRAEGMPRCEAFTRSIPGISREAQACGALERKFRMPGLDLEHIRFWMKGGFRVKMLLGERVTCLERHVELRHDIPMAHVGDVPVYEAELDAALGRAGITVSVFRGDILEGGGEIAKYFEGDDHAEA